MKSGKAGFALLTAALAVLLTLSLSLALVLRMTNRWDLTRALEAQLHSLVLAENGIEYARTLLPHVEIGALLVGLDGVHCGTEIPEWRSPMSLREAAEIVPGSWSALCDDGLPTHQGELLLPQGYLSQGGGYFFLRFSNNPEESPDRDEDGEVLVRSLGIVPQPTSNPDFPEIRNSFALVEARLRQERPFLLPSPLTLFGDSGTFLWGGEIFTIDGDDHFGVSLISTKGRDLQDHLLHSLSEAQGRRITGHGISPSIQDALPVYQSDPRLQPLLNSDFWRHFLDQLPGFADAPHSAISFLPEGGHLEELFSGLLVARKDLVVGNGGGVEGLLLHLGEGSLSLRDGARVEGGIWMSSPDLPGSGADAGQLTFEISGSARIFYRPDFIQDALVLLPPSQLGWRILFSETVR